MTQAALVLKSEPAKTHFVGVIQSYAIGMCGYKIVKFVSGETKKLKDSEIEYFRYQMS